MTNAEKVRRLNAAVEALELADRLVGEVYGESDVGEETQARINELIVDLIADIVELDVNG